MTEASGDPVRRCVGCGRRAPKRALLRIAAGPRGVAVDPTGGAAGRGAYVHGDAACVTAAMRPGKLARALRRGLTPGELGRLKDDIERMGMA